MRASSTRPSSSWPKSCSASAPRPTRGRSRVAGPLTAREAAAVRPMAPAQPMALQARKRARRSRASTRKCECEPGTLLGWLSQQPADGHRLPSPLILQIGLLTARLELIGLAVAVYDVRSTHDRQEPLSAVPRGRWGLCVACSARNLLRVV